MSGAREAGAKQRPFRVHCLTIGAGGGHNATIRAVQAAAREQGRCWEVEVLDVIEQLESLDPFKRLTGLAASDLYNRMLRSGWTWIYPLLLGLARASIRLRYEAGKKVLADWWAARPPPDLVLSVVPFFNRGAWETLREAAVPVPYAILVTDFADHPPRFWIEPDTDAYVLCGTRRLVSQARALGVAADRVIDTSGMPVHPQFYAGREALDRGAGRRALDLDPDLVTAVVLFGAHGSRSMVEIVRQLEPLAGRLQLLLLCGHDEALARRLRRAPGRLHRVVVGFTDEVPRYLRLADFLIGKPGPGAVSESLVSGLPVIAVRGRFPLLQERSVAEWIESEGVGLAPRLVADLRPAAEALLEPERCRGYRERVGRLANRAVFEIPDCLERIAGRAG